MDFGDVFAQHAFLTLSHRERGQNGGWDFFIFRWPLGAVGVMLFVFCCGFFKIALIIAGDWGMDDVLWGCEMAHG